MPTTTNYGWTTPADTDLVKDGAAAIRTLGSSIDTTLKTQIDAQIPDSLLTTKGDIIAASGASTPARLAVGSDGQVLTADAASASGVKWATPTSGAITWTLRTTGTSGFNAIAYNGSNLYVAVGGSGVLYSSTDGKTWTSRTSGFGANQIYHVAYGNGLFVAVGATGLITTSTDGTTWTARTSGFGSLNIYRALYANSIWVVVGAGGGATNTGGVSYSSDGLTWTRKSQSLTVGANYYCVAWNGTNWIIGANNSTNNYLYASTPSGTWTAGATGSSQGIYDIFWDGTRNITLETNDFRYSTSATLGTTTQYNAAKGLGVIGQSFAQLYNSNIYYGTLFMSYFTPATSANPAAFGVPFILPTTNVDGSAAGGLIYSLSAFYIGAAGYILSDQYGRIYTSF
jgi:hypothetical protein